MSMNLKAARIGARLFNLLFAKGDRKERIALRYLGDRIKVVQGCKAPLYEGLLFGNPKKDARVLMNAVQAIVCEAKKKAGEWYGPKFAEEIGNRLLQEVC